jgi:putative MATE family efflux protein
LSAQPVISKARLSAIFGLALPIIGGMLSQNVLNLVDTLMVGSLGDVALAAVGIASFVQFMCTAFITGISAGVQAIAARRIGEERPDESAVPLNGGLLIAASVGVPLTAVLLVLLPVAFPLVATDPRVCEVGIDYLSIRFFSVVALAANFSFRGFWNGIGRSHVYFRTIVAMHMANIVLNYLLIFGKFGFPRMGASGAALASALAFYIGTALYFFQGFRLARDHGFLRCLPTREELVSLLRLSTPTGLQQTFFAAGMTVFFAMLSRVGTSEVAASNVLVNLLLVVILPSIGFGLAAATLVGQSLGRRDLRAARRWGGDVVRVALVVMTTVGALGALAPHLLLAPFLHDPATLRLAEAPLRLIALSLPLDAIGLVLMQAMIGAGHTRRVMVLATALQWCLQLPLVYLVAFVLDWNLTAIWGTHFAYRAVQTFVLYHEWRSERWAEIKV